MSQSDVSNELDALSSDVNTLKARLNQINSEKEKWFHKKEELKVKVNELIKQLKEMKTNNETSSKTYDELKKERDKYNSQVQSLIGNLKKLSEQKKEVFDKYKITSDPSYLKDRMDKLEQSIETDALSFKKETQIMDQIKRLKKQYDESKKVGEVLEKANQASKQLNEAKEKANHFHQRLLETAKNTGYAAFIELTKQINNLRKEQEAAFKMFIKMKNEFVKISTFLKAKIVGQKNASKENYAKEHNQKTSKNDEILKKRIETVEEKLKAKKKLTTEDFLALQGRK